MKRLVAIVLLAGLTPASPSRAADHLPGTLVPTSPSVPAPVFDGGGMVVPASGVSRIVPPVRERAANPLTQPLTTSTPMPLPTGYQTPGVSGGGCAAGNCAPADCGPARSRGACYDRFKAWLCFQPTTGDALPKFRPHPYVGPIAGTFSCNSDAGCATNAGCATGACGTTNGCAATAAGRPGLTGRIGGLMPAREGRVGCVPPSPDAFPGYHFAESRPPSATAHGSQPAPVPVAPPGYTSYKPTSQPSQPSQPRQAMPVSVQPREPQSRTSPPVAGPTIMPAAAQMVQPKDKTAPTSIRWASWPAR